jgi:hypothetical protein
LPGQAAGTLDPECALELLVSAVKMGPALPALSHFTDRSYRAGAMEINARSVRNPSM